MNISHSQNHSGIIAHPNKEKMLVHKDDSAKKMAVTKGLNQRRSEWRESDFSSYVGSVSFHFPVLQLGLYHIPHFNTSIRPLDIPWELTFYVWKKQITPRKKLNFQQDLSMQACPYNSLWYPYSTQNHKGSINGAIFSSTNSSVVQDSNMETIEQIIDNSITVLNPLENQT